MLDFLRLWHNDLIRYVVRENRELSYRFELLAAQRKPFGFMLDDHGFLRPECEV